MRQLPSCLAGIVSVLGLLYLGHQRSRFRHSVEDQLAAIADLKVRQIVGWRQERLADARAIMLDPLPSQAVRQFLAGASTNELRAPLQGWLTSIYLTTESIRAMLLDPEFQVRLAAPENQTYLGPIAQTFAVEAFRSNQVVISDLHRSHGTGYLHFDVAVPIPAPNQATGPGATNAGLANPQPIAVVDLELDPAQFLYPLIQSWPTPSRTAETLLVRREGDEVLFLNDLRHRTNTALAFRLPLARTNAPAVLAVLGREGTVEGPDYRGELVLAAVRKVPGTSWRLVSKMDQREVFAPFQRDARLILLTIFSAVAAAGLVSWGLWRRQEARFLKQELATRERLESALTFERDLLTTLLESTPDALYFKDLQSRFVRCSHYFKNLFNVTDTGLILGKTDFDFFAKEHAQPAYEDEQEIIRTGRPIIGKQEQETHLDGRVTWALTTKMPWRDKDGRIIGTFGISKDITVIKEAEARLGAMHRQLLGTSRLAGMAEVATGVLHNIGNVLNSVNVASSCAADLLRNSKVATLSQLAEPAPPARAGLVCLRDHRPQGQTVACIHRPTCRMSPCGKGVGAPGTCPTAKEH